MIQDIHPHLFNNTYKQGVKIQDEDYLFYFQENKLLLKKTKVGLEIPKATDLSFHKSGTFLFTINNSNCFLIEEGSSKKNGIFSFEEINYLNTIDQKEINWLSVMALQLKTWYEKHQFCGKCGTTLQHKSDERALICPNCNNVIYPTIAPAIIVAILCKDKILLARNVNFREGYYSLVAGYLEVGETLEDCVKREVHEEIGIDVKNIRYYKSQPWPYSSSMMIGFIAEGDDTQPINIDHKEIADANWYSRDNLPNHPPTRSIAGDIIEKYVNGEL